MCSRGRLVALTLALAAVLNAGPALAADDVVLQAPNSLGQGGLVRTASATIDDTGTAWLGLSGRVFATPDFAVAGIADAATFVEANGSMGFSLFRALELSLQSRAGGVMTTARSQPQTSVGDTTMAVKAGYGFGLVAAAVTARLGLPSRANKVGYDLQNANVAGAGLVTFDLLEVGLPLRAHLNGGYALQLGRFASPDEASNPFFLDGEDGALIAMATQQWFYDQAHVGLGLEVPLPVVTPFLEVWYQTAVGTGPYNFFGDAWLTLTPGARFGIGGVRVDVALDIGASGNAGGLAIDPALVRAGQPINPLWAGRVAVAHTFDLAGGGGGGGGGSGRFARLEGCATADGAPVAGVVAMITIDGQPGPRLAGDDKGCFAAPVAKGEATVTVSAPGHSSVVVNAGTSGRADAVLAKAPSRGRLKGFITNKDDEAVEASLTIVDGGLAHDGGRSIGGAFEIDVAAGPVTVVARAPGYLALGHGVTVVADDRRTVILQLRKEPKKRSVTLAPDKLELANRVPYVFKSERLQSTAGYLLDEIADLMHSNPALRLSIEAHTDPSELDDASAAKALTEGRARVLKDALVDLGVAADRLETSGYGVTQLVGPANDPKNRRVELLVLK